MTCLVTRHASILFLWLSLAAMAFPPTGTAREQELPTAPVESLERAASDVAARRRSLEELLERRLTWQQVADEEIGEAIEDGTRLLLECGPTGAVEWRMEAPDPTRRTRLEWTFVPQGTAEFGTTAIAKGDPLSLIVLFEPQQEGPARTAIALVHKSERFRPIEVLRSSESPRTLEGTWRFVLHHGLLLVTDPSGDRLDFPFDMQPADLVRLECHASGQLPRDVRIGVSVKQPLPPFAKRLRLVRAMAAEATFHAAFGRSDYVSAYEAARQVADTCRELLGPEHRYTLNGDGFVQVSLSQLGKGSESRALVHDLSTRNHQVLGGLHPATLWADNEVAHELERQGRHAEAVEVFRSLALASLELFGEDHALARERLRHWCRVAAAAGSIDEAIEVRERALAAELRFGTAKGGRLDRIELAILKFRRRDDSAAAFDLAEAVRDLPDDEVAEVRHRAGMRLDEIGRFVEAQEHLKMALAAAEAAGEDRRSAEILASLASVASDIGTRREQLELLEAQLEIVRRLDGAESRASGEVLLEIVDVLSDLGRYPEALAAAAQAESIAAATSGVESVAYAEAITARGRLLTSMERYSEAEVLMRRALEIHRAVFAEASEDYAYALAETASVHQRIGDLETAIDLTRTAVETLERLGVERTRGCATLYARLASYVRTTGDLDQAEMLHRRAAEIRRELFGESSVQYADSLQSLGIVAMLDGRLDEAQELLHRSNAMFGRLAEDRPVDNLNSNYLLGLVAHHRGDTETAVAKYLETLATIRSGGGDGGDRSFEATLLENLGFIASGLGDVEQADRHYAEALALRERLLIESLPAFGRRQRIELLGSTRISLDARLSLAVETGRVAELYPHVAAWKGAAAGLQEPERDEPAVSSLQERLRDLRRRLAAEVGDGSLLVDPESARRRLAELTRAKEELEADLARATAGAAPAADREIAARLVSQLNEGEALVDLLQFTYRTQTSLGRSGYLEFPRLLAFVIRKDRAPTVVDLGDARTLAVEIAEFRGLIHGDPERLEAARRRLGNRLADPLADALDGIDRLVLSPDGSTAAVPWGVLPWGDADHLIERVRMVQVDSARRWLEERRRPTTTSPDASARPTLLALGGATYAEDASTRLLDPSSTRRAADLFLPGTEAEVRQSSARFASRFPGAEVVMLTGSEATKQAVVTSLESSPRFVHLATHGLLRDPGTRRATAVDLDGASMAQRGFTLADRTPPASTDAATPPALPDASTPRTDLGAEDTATGPSLPTSDDSMRGRLAALGSALLLAPSNESSLPDDLLTAEEVESFDLRGTEVVLLSACETGLGLQRSGQGVIGLQQSFRNAGARNVIGTLWSVEDEPTAVVVDEFYRGLWERGLAPADALREAQLFVLHHPEAVAARMEAAGSGPLSTERSPIAWWGSFVIYGVEPAASPLGAADDDDEKRERIEGP